MSEKKMRPLTEEEKDLTNKNLKRLKEDIAGDEVFKEHLVFNIERFIDYTAKLNKNRAKQELKLTDGRILENEEAIRLTEEALKSGVEVIEEPKTAEQVGKPAEEGEEE